MQLFFRFIVKQGGHGSMSLMDDKASGEKTDMNVSAVNLN